MATTDVSRSRTSDGAMPRAGDHGITRRLSTETKAAFKTTEFFAYLGVLASLLIAGLVSDASGEAGFAPQEVWLYAVLLTIGYMISRGLAKAGSRDPYNDDDGDSR